MKKLLLLSVALFALCACNKDNMDGTMNRPTDMKEVVPHFYGWMTLDDPSSETRGVANAMKIWSKPIAKNHLTVKFLNGTESYQKFVKDVAKEWEKYADVKFKFVDDDQDAVVRVGFDYVRGMSSSWALTGTDHMQKYSNQDEATVHFAQWRRTSDEAKRSDVLRAFGQVLGLELEFRHPNFDPQWETDENGNIDEPFIRDYWENELNELISWEELRKIVLEPLSSQTFMIEKTESYDENSVMSWPFFDMIAQNIPLIEFDEDHKTELSEMDKGFIKQLYGEPNFLPGDEEYVKLITFDYSGLTPEITLTTSKDLVVIWDYPKKDISYDEVTYIEVPSDTTSMYTTTVKHQFTESKTRQIVIGELLAYGQTRPNSSYALKQFDLNSGVGMENLDLSPVIPNTNLSYVRIQGGKSFKAQELTFNGNQYLKELYLTKIGDSKVTIDNCQNLEVFATSDNIWRLDLEALGINGNNDAQDTQLLSDDDEPVNDLVINELFVRIDPIQQIDPADLIPLKPWHPIHGIIDWPIEQFSPWPCDPQQHYSLSNNNGSGLTILNCPNLKMLSLENTRINTLNLTPFNELEYIYLSSTPEYIVGNANGVFLLNTLLRVTNRNSKSHGQIIIRGIKYYDTTFPSSYRYSPVEFPTNTINSAVTKRNWAICWDPTFEWETNNTSEN